MEYRDRSGETVQKVSRYLSIFRLNGIPQQIPLVYIDNIEELKKTVSLYNERFQQKGKEVPMLEPPTTKSTKYVEIIMFTLAMIISLVSIGYVIYMIFIES